MSISADELKLRRESVLNLTNRLRGAVVPSLRALVMRVEERCVEARFIIDGPTSEALEELLNDLINDAEAGVPAALGFNLSVELVPAPEIIVVSPTEQLLFHRWEPGQRRLDMITTSLGSAQYPPPSQAQISDLTQAVTDGRYTHHEVATWARYWTTSGDDPSRPDWYRMDLWSTLRQIAADDPGPHRPAPILVDDASLSVRDRWLTALTTSLVGAVPWTLRAVVLGVDAPRIWVRFVIDSTTTSDALVTLLDDVATDTVAGIPNNDEYTFDYAIESVLEPGIIHLSDNEFEVYKRCEPGHSRLLAPIAPLGVATNPPPPREEIAEVLQQLADGAVPRYPASSWARYWTATIDKPHWYSSEHWSILEEIATCDRWVQLQPDAELIQRPDDHYRELLASL